MATSLTADFINACNKFPENIKPRDKYEVEEKAGKLMEYLDSYLSREDVRPKDKTQMEKAFKAKVSQYLDVEDKQHYKSKDFGKPDKNPSWSETLSSATYDAHSLLKGEKPQTSYTLQTSKNEVEKSNVEKHQEAADKLKYRKHKSI